MASDERRTRRLLRRAGKQPLFRPRVHYFLIEHELADGWEVFVGKTSREEHGGYTVAVMDSKEFDLKNNKTASDKQHLDQHLEDVVLRNTPDGSSQVFYDVAAIKRAKAYQFHHGSFTGFLSSLSKRSSRGGRETILHSKNLYLLQERSTARYLIGESTMNAPATKGCKDYFRLSDVLILAKELPEHKDGVLWLGGALRNNPDEKRFTYDLPRNGNLKLKRNAVDVIAQGSGAVVDYLVDNHACYEVAGIIADQYGLDRREPPRKQRVSPKPSSKPARQKEAAWGLGKPGGYSLKHFQF